MGQVKHSPRPDCRNLIDLASAYDFGNAVGARLLQAALLAREAEILSQDRDLPANPGLRESAIKDIADIIGSLKETDVAAFGNLASGAGAFPLLNKELTSRGIDVQYSDPSIDIGMFAAPQEAQEQPNDEGLKKIRDFAEVERKALFADLIDQSLKKVFAGAEQRRLNEILLLCEASSDRKSIGTKPVRQEMTADLFYWLADALIAVDLCDEDRDQGMLRIGDICRISPPFSNGLDDAVKHLSAIMKDEDRLEAAVAAGRPLPASLPEASYCLKRCRELRDYPPTERFRPDGMPIEKKVRKSIVRSPKFN